MGRGWPLQHAGVLGLLFTGIIIIIIVTGNPATGEGLSIEVKEKGRSVTLLCKGGRNTTSWTKDGYDLSSKGKELPLGSAMDDPRGFYQCYDEEEKRASLQVFFRMCQNCVHLDFSTILGIMLASFVATLFLAIAVYCFAVEEPRLQSQASDKQNLLANEQLYQPLGERNNGQYSHIGVPKARHR